MFVKISAGKKIGLNYKGTNILGGGKNGSIVPEERFAIWGKRGDFAGKMFYSGRPAHIFWKA